MFQGMRHDPAKPLCEGRPRAMHPSLARFAEQEPSPSVYVEGRNLYTACNDMPANARNPLGA